VARAFREGRGPPSSCNQSWRKHAHRERRPTAGRVVSARHQIGVTVATTLSTTDSCGIYPGFRPPVLVRVGDGSRAVAIADFNVDGRPDIATADEYAHTATILLNGTAFAGRP